MSFRTDPQTLNDLRLLGSAGACSVYQLYDNARTRGGSNALERMFLQPLTDAAQINRRSEIIQYFRKRELPFPFEAETLDRAEAYLAMTDERTMLSHADDTLRRRVSQWLSADGDYTVIVHGIGAIAQIVRTLARFVQETRPSAESTAYREELDEMAALLRHEAFAAAGAEALRGKLSYRQVVDADKELRFRHRRPVQQLLEHIYQLDVYLTVAQVASQRRYVFPVAVEKERHTMRLIGVRHPLVSNAVGNTLTVTPQRNLVFLTGANMAGKSTFMKSVAIAFYVAHVGFPVAAEAMEFSVADGLYTTINLSDDLNAGVSHFYAEVLRIKQIARELSGERRLLIMFDELFRGTNVRDAHEGTVAVTQAFAARADCMFVISTHIIEAGEVLRGQCENIQFVFMPTRMEGTTPVYPYRLESGITSDRHGMVIINNERILEILRSRKSARRHSERRT
jgi:DNA mismatch repair protein MutS